MRKKITLKKGRGQIFPCFSPSWRRLGKRISRSCLPMIGVPSSCLIRKLGPKQTYMRRISGCVKIQFKIKCTRISLAAKCVVEVFFLVQFVFPGTMEGGVDFLFRPPLSGDFYRNSHNDERLNHCQTGVSVVEWVGKIQTDTRYDPAS